MNNRIFYNTLKAKIQMQLDLLGKKYNISEDDTSNFMETINIRPPIRNKTILQESEKCHSRKQDGTQCTRRHKVNERFCGKHLKKRPYGIFKHSTGHKEENTTIKQSTSKQSTSKQPTSKQSTSKQPTSKQPTSKQPTSNQPTSKQPTSKQLKAKQLKAKQLKAKQLKAKQLKAKQLKAKQLKAKQLKKKAKEDMIVLKSVQIHDTYYYIDDNNILYNPEPINGLYEVIGKLTGDMDNREIYYVKS
jgi:hypothetical protein